MHDNGKFTCDHIIVRFTFFVSFLASKTKTQDYATFRGWGSRRIDGNTPAAERQRYIDDFNQSTKNIRKGDAEKGGVSAEGKSSKEAETVQGKGDGREEDAKPGGNDAETGSGGGLSDIFLFFLSTKAGGQAR